MILVCNLNLVKYYYIVYRTKHVKERKKKVSWPWYGICIGCSVSLKCIITPKWSVPSSIRVYIECDFCAARETETSWYRPLFGHHRPYLHRAPQVVIRTQTPNIVRNFLTHLPKPQKSSGPSHANEECRNGWLTIVRYGVVVVIRVTFVHQWGA